VLSKPEQNLNAGLIDGDIHESLFRPLAPMLALIFLTLQIGYFVYLRIKGVTQRVQNTPG
jgi:hypothetical protein